MRHDLAELLLKLRHYEKAEKVLQMALEHDPGRFGGVLLCDRTIVSALHARYMFQRKSGVMFVEIPQAVTRTTGPNIHCPISRLSQEPLDQIYTVQFQD